MGPAAAAQSHLAEAAALGVAMVLVAATAWVDCAMAAVAGQGVPMGWHGRVVDAREGHKAAAIAAAGQAHTEAHAELLAGCSMGTGTGVAVAAARLGGRTAWVVVAACRDHTGVASGSVGHPAPVAAAAHLLLSLLPALVFARKFFPAPLPVLFHLTVHFLQLLLPALLPSLMSLDPLFLLIAIPVVPILKHLTYIRAPSLHTAAKATRRAAKPPTW